MSTWANRRKMKGGACCCKWGGKKGVRSDIAVLEVVSCCTGSDIMQDLIQKMNSHKPMQENTWGFFVSYNWLSTLIPSLLPMVPKNSACYISSHSTFPLLASTCSTSALDNKSFLEFWIKVTISLTTMIVKKVPILRKLPKANSYQLSVASVLFMSVNWCYFTEIQISYQLFTADIETLISKI